MSFNFKQANIQRYNTYTHSSTTALKLTAENSGSLILCDCSANYITIDLPPNLFNGKRKTISSTIVLEAFSINTKLGKPTVSIM